MNKQSRIEIMKQNLAVASYRNGDEIPLVTDPKEWVNLTTGARCAYNNDEANVEAYGYLYNWYAVNDPRGLAPEGWRVPTIKEWDKILKIHCYEGWKRIADSNLWLPGGYRGDGDGTFSYLGYFAYYWSATAYDSNGAWYRFLYYDSSGVYRYYRSKHYGFSVRCVREV